jgi:threonine synthase
MIYLHRAISKGHICQEKVSETISPSMDIQIASNFERLIYDLNNCNDTKTISAMKDIKEKGKYLIDKENLDKINIDFLSSQ